MITTEESRSPQSGPEYGGSDRSKLGWASSVMVSAPAAPAASGPKSRSQSAPGAPPPAASDSERIRAAATGVPKSAPMVPAEASAIHRAAGVRGAIRRPSQKVSAILAAVIGFSGPRLTPPASARTVTTSSPGMTSGGMGGSTSPVVAGSGPA